LAAYPFAFRRGRLGTSGEQSFLLLEKRGEKKKSPILPKSHP